MFGSLHAAGASGLSTEEWNDRARNVELGEKRKEDLWDFRAALKGKKLVHRYGDRWTVAR